MAVSFILPMVTGLSEGAASGFGTIALIAAFPILTMQILGCIYKIVTIKNKVVETTHNKVSIIEFDWMQVLGIENSKEETQEKTQKKEKSNKSKKKNSKKVSNKKSKNKSTKQKNLKIKEENLVKEKEEIIKEESEYLQEIVNNLFE